MLKEIIVNPNVTKATVSSIVIIALLVYAAYIYFRKKTLEDIRKDVYRLFCYVENRFKETGSGERKMQYVVNAAYNMLPAIARYFITKETLKTIIQGWFNDIKDLLDNGKLDSSAKKSE